jgi:hypothetical protein
VKQCSVAFDYACVNDFINANNSVRLLYLLCLNKTSKAISTANSGKEEEKSLSRLQIRRNSRFFLRIHKD